MGMVCIIYGEISEDSGPKLPWDGIILESSFEKNSKYEIILKF